MKKMLMVVAALACAVALAGCAGAGSLQGEDADGGACQVTADNAAKGAAYVSLGDVEIAKGQLLVLSPVLQKGSLQVELFEDADEDALDQTVSGSVLSTYEVDPGSYSMRVTCAENGTTGTLLVHVMDAAEFERQNQALDAALSDAAAAAEATRAS